MPIRRRQPAFSLLELVIVLAIMTILASMALPRFGSAAVRQRADAAARRVVGDLEFARHRASQTSASQKVDFDVGGNRYRLPGFRDPDRPSSDYEVRLGEEPYNAAILSVDFASNTSLEFDGFGLPVGLGGTPGEVILQVGVESRTIKVDPDTGEAELQ
jgi:prepilin-type N-terminal cleavage/methylation domain-containing protein